MPDEAPDGALELAVVFFRLGVGAGTLEVVGKVPAPPALWAKAAQGDKSGVNIIEKESAEIMPFLAMNARSILSSPKN